MRALTDYRGTPSERDEGRLDLRALTAPPTAPDAGLRTRGVFDARRRHWALALGAPRVVGALASVVALSVPNRYQSWAAVLVEARANQVVNIANVVPDV